MELCTTPLCTIINTHTHTHIYIYILIPLYIYIMVLFICFNYYINLINHRKMEFPQNKH